MFVLRHIMCIRNLNSFLYDNVSVKWQLSDLQRRLCNKLPVSAYNNNTNSPGGPE